MPSEKLILIIDRDTEWSTRTAGMLLASSYKTALALNGQQALEMIAQLHPQLILLNIDALPATENPILPAAQNCSTQPPVLCLTSVGSLDSAEISEVLKQGAYDCLPKHCAAELLLKRIDSALKNSAADEPAVQIQQFSLFFDRVKRLNASRNLDTLIDLAFEYFSTISRADHAAFFLYLSEKHSWKKVRGTSMTRLFPDETTLDQYCRRIAATGQSFIERFRLPVAGKKSANDAASFPSTSILAIPIITGNDLSGAVVLQRITEDDPFLSRDQDAAEIIAGQVGSAFVNHHLYDTVNHKLAELQVISSYSEKLMGMVDKYDVLRSLCETAARHLNADIAGVFIVQRRAHDFLHWSRYVVPEKQLQEYCNEAIAAYNKAVETPLRTRRINYTPFKLDKEHADPSTPMLPAAFRYVVPLCWDDLKFGAVVIASIKEPEYISSRLAMFSSIIGQTHIALTNTKLYSDMKENYIRTIKALAIAVDAKDTYTHGHSENVMNIAEAIARELSIDDETVSIIRDAGLLHDIGKIGIPGYILNKPGPLTYEEFNGIMKTHSTLGANIVKDVPFLRDLYKLILFHHEHYDGNGYPDGLKGEQIPLGARIIHVADAFEAMTSDRPYRLRLGQTEALKRLNEGSGSQFDPAIIAAFMRVAKKENLLQEKQADHPFPFPHA